VQRSRALAAGSRAALGPAGGVSARMQAAQASAHEAPALSSARRRTETASTGIELQWELDLFGRLRAQAQAAGARVQATEAQAAAMRLAVSAEIAQAYFALRREAAAALVVREQPIAQVLGSVARIRVTCCSLFVDGLEVQLADVPPGREAARDVGRWRENRVAFAGRGRGTGVPRRRPWPGHSRGCLRAGSAALRPCATGGLRRAARAASPPGRRHR
jgi:hypothetical protein